MSKPSLEEGFEFWAAEVETQQLPSDYADGPVTGLVGVYLALGADQGRTSYAWRQRVISSEAALRGLRTSLREMFTPELGEYAAESFPISRVLPRIDGVHVPNQIRQENESITDGLPEPITTMTITVAEYFLARTLGHAGHDYMIGLKPLRLTDTGLRVFGKFYPDTANFIATKAVE